MAKTKFRFKGDVIAKLQEGSYTYFYNALANNFGGEGSFLDIVKSFILVGISPVYKAGRFKRYSESYRLFIQGKIRFITMRGNALPIFPYVKKISKKSEGKGEYTPLNIKKGAIVKNKLTGNSGKTTKFPPPIPGKKISPVNMLATGEMLESMYLERRGKTRIVVGFKDKKAVYHDKLGAGKSKVLRRLLPTRQGERFITNIDSRLKRLGKLAIAQSMNNQKASLAIRYVFKIKL